MNRRIIAIDTATEVVAIGLGALDGGQVQVLGIGDVHAPRAALAQTLPCVLELLASAGLQPADIDLVVVGRGPGSFTGVRIGVSIAKGLAHGLGVPLFGVGTLDAIAHRLQPLAGAPTLVGVLGDAMRSEVYPALFRVCRQGVERLEEDSVAQPAAVAARWASLGEPILLTGNALHKYRDVFGCVEYSAFALAEEALWSPSGEALLAAFEAQWAAGSQGSGDAAALLPVYTRASDAEENERKAAEAGGSR